MYGYTDKFDDLKEVLLSNTFTVVPSLRYGISQKNNADIQLVIDALEVAYKNELIDSTVQIFKEGEDLNISHREIYEEAVARLKGDDLSGKKAGEND